MKGDRNRNWLRKAAASVLLFVFALGLTGPLLFANPKPARAQVTVPISDMQNTIVNIWDTLKDQFVGGAINALMSGANYFLSKMAYELAVSLTSDCPGQVVCWDTQNFKDGIKAAGKGAFGSMVETLSEEGGFSELGLNLCQPNVDLSLRLQLGIVDEVSPPAEPSCTFDSFKDNWAAVGDQFTTEEVLGNWEDVFSGQGELSVSFRVLDVANKLSADAEREAGLNKLSESAMGGFGDIADIVSGRVIAPGSTVEKEYDRMKKEKEDEPKETAKALSSGALARGAVMSLVMNFTQTFVQTFLGRLWSNFTDGLISSEEAIQAQPDIILSAEGLFRPPGRSGARDVLTKLLAPAQKELGEIDLLLHYSVCPEQGRTPQNCVMDEQFAAAVRVAGATPYTVREALAEGYLHGEWPFIPASDARNQDADCYSMGYCESNLKRLRSSRIIPIGWEIAASKARGAYANITLQSVVDAFDDCNSEGAGDEFHPFCHLIDPNWVLLAPAANCRVSGYGPHLLSPTIPQRQEQCVDIQTCLRQDDFGQCVGGWGYCLREENVWRFNADQCPAHYNTCRTLNPADGSPPVNYLMNTLDFGICNADNVGCAQYAAELNINGDEEDPSDDWFELPGRFFNDQVETCNPRDNGCTSLIKLGKGQSLNLIPNSNFELVDGDQPTDWAISQGEVVSDSGTQQTAVVGGRSYFLDGQAVFTDFLPITAGKMYTVSGVFTKDAAEAGLLEGGIGVFFYDASGNSIPGQPLATFSTFSDYLEQYDTSVGIADPCQFDANEVVMFFSHNDAAATELRAACSFFIDNPDAVYAVVSFAGPDYVDATQFEQGPLTPYHEDYNSSQTVNIKVAPDYLGCIGEPEDREECGSYAAVCRENEVGCQLYTPRNGDPAVPGIVGPQDYCPSECSGYDMFFQETTDFEIATDDPVHFIPSTANQCSAADVGCTAFTSIETEAVEYFSRLRICQAPDDDDTAVYYTWEGSDTTGYQLRSWSLKRTASNQLESATDVCEEPGCLNAGQAPCIGLASDATSCNDTEIDGLCSRAAIDAGNFDCREFYDVNGNRHYRQLSRTIIATADCQRYRITDSSAEDCAHWNGRWVPGSSECIYRASPSWSRACDAAAAGCRSYRGNAASNVRTLFVDDFEFEPLNTWSADPVSPPTVLQQSSESLVVGGHSLQIRQGSVVREVGSEIAAGNLYSVSFWARGSGDLLISLKPGQGSVCRYDDDDAAATCPNVGGCSCATDDNLNCLIGQGASSCTIAPADAGVTVVAEPLTIFSEWNQYEIGPLEVGDPGDVTLSDRSVSLAVQSTGATPEAYIDNLVFKRVRDNIAVIKDSWETPRSCDSTLEGIFSPLEMLGCKTYNGSDGQVHNLRSFSSLCRETAVGCQAYSDTQNTEQTGWMTYGAVCLLDSECTSGPNCPCDYDLNSFRSGGSITLTDVCRVPVGADECRFDLEGLGVVGNDADYPDRFHLPADERIFLAADSGDTCPQTAVGCTNMGVPVTEFERECQLTTACADENGCDCTDALSGQDCEVDQGSTSCVVSLDEGLIGSWRGAVLKDDPANYEQTLCEMEAVGCEAYAASDGARYFKSPGNQLCQYKTNVNYNGARVNGWFRVSQSGLVFPCYQHLLREGSVYDIYRNGDRGYSGWVGACSAEYDRCEEFVDPLDTSTTNPEGKPYYYLDNNKLDKSSCEGRVSLEEGCVLLDQTSNTQSLYSAPASYLRSSSEGNGQTVNAVNCNLPENSRNAYCNYRCHSLVNRTCADFEGRECTIDSDCGDNGSCERNGRCSTFCSENSDCGGGICTGESRWGMGCSLATENRDCNISQGETCLAYDNVANDSNIIVKVRRDRDCAEWLECDNYQSVFDSSKGAWVSRCAHFNTCNETSQVGDSTVCTGFNQTPAEIFTQEDYGSRDINWYGQEYSGYTIIDRYPLQHLWPYKITKGFCAIPDDGVTAMHRNDDSLWRCSTSDQCTQACDENNMQECRDGTLTEDQRASLYCTAPLGGVCQGGADNGKSCSSTDDCTALGADNGFCSKSDFDLIRFGVKRSLCRKGDFAGEQCFNDEDCYEDFDAAVADGAVNTNRACATTCSRSDYDSADDPLDGCPPDGYQVVCDEDGCPEPYGTCAENVCVYDYRGGPLIVEDVVNAPACRAYPEADSPFPPNVLDVEAAQNVPNTSDKVTPGYNNYGNAFAMKPGFLGANVCYEANSCDCYYTRVGYGQAGTAVRYHSIDSSWQNREGEDDRGGVGELVRGLADGVCVGGEKDGMSCRPGDDGDDNDDKCGSSGSCMGINTYAKAMGWPGYCVDYDSSTRLYADPDTKGCNLWLPVDFIPGMGDAFNENPSAGFLAPSDQLLHCLAVDTGPGGVCEGNLNQLCANDEECSSQGLGRCLDHVRKMIKSDANFQFSSRLFAFADSFQDNGGGNSDDCRFRDDDSCNTHVNLQGYLGQGEDGVRFGGSVNIDNIAGALMFLPGDGAIWMDHTTDYGFALHWNAGRANTSTSGNFREDGESPGFETYDVGNQTYYVNQASPNESSCLSWLVNRENTEVDSPCRRDEYNQGKDSCIAARLLADELGRVNGVEGMICNSTSNAISHIVHMYGVWLTQRESCTEIGVTTDNQNNVAWTDVLYKLSLGVAVPGFEGLQDYYVNGPFLSEIAEMDESNTPLGAIAPSVNLESDTFSYPIPIVGPIDDQNSDGNGYMGSPATLVEVNAEAGEILYTANDPVYGSAVAAGFAYGNSGRVDQWLVQGEETVINGRLPESLKPLLGTSNGRQIINRLFAVIYGVYSWDNSDGKYVLNTTDEIDWDSRLRQMELAQTETSRDIRIDAPRVVPASTGSEQCQDENTVCPEGRNEGLTVNGKTDDICSGDGNVTVNIAYYAYADSDHMPIRRHIVDFSDGSDPLLLPGTFKNHRGIAAGSRICGSDNNDFGKSADACNSSYIEYTKTYTCSTSYANALPLCRTGARQVFPCRDAAGSCIYKPRVQILDNWGVCNGVCENTNPAVSDRADGALCFNGATDGFLYESTDPTDSINECKILNSRERIYEPDQAPYTAFDGLIVVSPGGNCRGAVIDEELDLACSDDFDCASGLCLEGGTCAQSCAEPIDCRPGLVCDDSFCLTWPAGRCDDNVDCPLGQTCAGSSCVDTCQNDSDCPADNPTCGPGSYCTGGLF